MRVERPQSRAGADDGILVRYLLLSLLLLLAACDSADPEIGQSEILFRTPLVDHALDVASLPGGGFVIAGATEGRIGIGDWTNAFPLLLRVDPRLGPADTAVYRDIRYGTAEAVVPFDDGLAVLIKKANYDEGGVDPPDLTIHYTTKIGLRERVLFEYPDAFPSHDPLLSTRDGGLLLGIFRSGLSSPDLIKVGRTGAVEWTYRMADVQDVRVVSETSDGDLYVFGPYNDSRRFALARLTSDGQEKWRRVYDDETPFRPVSVRSAEGGAVLLGRVFVRKPGIYKVALMRVDGEGNMEWEREYASGHIHPSVLTVLPGGEIVFAFSEEYEYGEPGHTRSYITAVDEDGAERWRARFGPRDGTTFVRAIVQIPGGRIAAVGSTGPEFIDGYGGDDFDALSVVYDL